MVEQFFPGGGGHLHLSRHNSITLLSGPPSCGKTSLLFQLAFNTAATATHSKGKVDDVVFICNRRKLESRPPYLSLGVDPSSDTFGRIKIKYVDDDEGIKKYFAAFHMYESHTFPSAVIIDDFADFFDQRTCQERYGNPRGRELAM